MALLGKQESPIDVLKYITKLSFAPNLAVTLRILLTIPITVASGERSFSKLKLIRNYFRSNIIQNRLNGLAILAIEHEIADKINLNDVIKKFSELKRDSQRFRRIARADSKGVKGDAVELDRKNVSFDFPDQLFNKSFSTLTNVSKAFSNLLMNSARRYSRFVLFFKPVFGDALVVKGAEDPTTTTTSKPVMSDSSNEI